MHLPTKILFLPKHALLKSSRSRKTTTVLMHRRQQPQRQICSANARFDTIFRLKVFTFLWLIRVGTQTELKIRKIVLLLSISRLSFLKINKRKTNNVLVREHSWHSIYFLTFSVVSRQQTKTTLKLSAQLKQIWLSFRRLIWCHRRYRRRRRHQHHRLRYAILLRERVFIFTSQFFVAASFKSLHARKMTLKNCKNILIVVRKRREICAKLFSLLIFHEPSASNENKNVRKLSFQCEMCLSLM